MNIQHTWVTPDQAATWLANNAKNNRKKSQKQIKQYARDMLSGNWRLTGEAIKFDSNGRLVDGQHRLEAIVMAKVDVEMVVITGLEPDTIQVLDTGKSRSAADALVISGNSSNSNAIAALARKIIAYRAGFSDPTNSKNLKVKGENITNREVLAFVAANDINLHVLFAARMKYMQVANVFGAGEWAFLHWLLGTIHQGHAEEFLQRLATLENVPANNTIRTLFDKLTKSSVTLTAKQRLNATLLAWNAFRTDQTLLKIAVSNIEGNVVPV